MPIHKAQHTFVRLCIQHLFPRSSHATSKAEAKSPHHPPRPSTRPPPLSEHNLVFTRLPQTQRHDLKPQLILLDLIILSHQKAIERRVLVAHSARLVPPLRHEACAQTRPVWRRVVVEAGARFDAI